MNLLSLFLERVRQSTLIVRIDTVVVGEQVSTSILGPRQRLAAAANINTKRVGWVLKLPGIEKDRQ